MSVDYDNITEENLLAVATIAAKRETRITIYVDPLYRVWLDGASGKPEITEYFAKDIATIWGADNLQYIF